MICVQSRNLFSAYSDPTIFCLYPTATRDLFRYLNHHLYAPNDNIKWWHALKEEKQNFKKWDFNNTGQCAKIKKKMCNQHETSWAGLATWGRYRKTRFYSEKRTALTATERPCEWKTRASEGHALLPSLCNLSFLLKQGQSHPDISTVELSPENTYLLFVIFTDRNAVTSFLPGRVPASCLGRQPSQLPSCGWI